MSTPANNTETHVTKGMAPVPGFSPMQSRINTSSRMAEAAYVHKRIIFAPVTQDFKEV